MYNFDIRSTFCVNNYVINTQITNELHIKGAIIMCGSCSMLICAFFAWFIRTFAVVLTSFIRDSSVKISRKEPQLFSLFPHIILCDQFETLMPCWV